MERVVVADHHEDIPRPDAQFFRCEVVAGFQMELIELRVLGRPFPGRPFGYGKDCKEDDRESDARDGGNLLGEKIDEAQRDERERDETKAERNLHILNLEVERNTKFTFSALLVPEHRDSETLHRKAPHEAERVRFSKHKDVAAAQQDLEQLDAHHEIQDAMRCPEPPMRMTKPLGENAVLRHPVQYAIRSDNRRVDRAREHECTDHRNEAAEGDSKRYRTHQVHREAANRVVLKTGPDGIRNDHHREKRHTGSEDQAIGENQETGLLEILQFRMLDIAIVLLRSLFAEHRQQGLAEATHESDADSSE